MKRLKATRMTVMFIVSAALCCAAFGEKKQPVSIKVPAQFTSVPVSGIAKDTSSLAEWWNNFHDPELESLIQRALVSNLDVRLAQAKLRESRATLKNTRASNQLPTVNADGSYTRSKTSSDNPQTPTLGGGTTLIPSTYGVYQSYFDASYELDIFGGVRNTVRAAKASAASSEDDLRNTLVSTLAEVARDYIQLREYQEQLKVARRQEASQKDTLRITEVRNKAGLVSDLDVANAGASLASTQSAMPSLESKVSQECHALAVLLDQNPGELDAELAAGTGLPAAPTEIPLGLPSELLRRRPDISEAEHNVTAAAAHVGVQVSKLFPSISLTAQYGGQSGSPGNLVESAARFYSIGPTIQWGLLNYPALKSNIRVYRAKRDEQVLTYQKTVLSAFQDVDDALAAYNSECARRKILEVEAAQYGRASTLALKKYTKGLTTFLDVLEAQRSLYSAEDSLAQSRATVQINLISLYKALGGGWENNDPVANSRNTR